MLNHESLILAPAVCRSGVVHDQPQCQRLSKGSQQFCQKLDWTDDGSLGAYSAHVDTHFSPMVIQWVEVLRYLGIADDQLSVRVAKSEMDVRQCCDAEYGRWGGDDGRRSACVIVPQPD